MYDLTDENGKYHARNFAKAGESVKCFEQNISIVVKVKRVVLSLHSHYTQYLGLPVDNILSGKNYQDIEIDCHGGLTFSGKGDGDLLSNEYYWYGWDYAHAGDVMWHEYLKPILYTGGFHDWTFKEVIDDGQLSMNDLIRQLVAAYSAANTGIESGGHEPHA